MQDTPKNLDQKRADEKMLVSARGAASFREKRRQVMISGSCSARFSRSR